MTPHPPGGGGMPVGSSASLVAGAEGAGGDAAGAWGAGVGELSFAELLAELLFVFELLDELELLLCTSTLTSGVFPPAGAGPAGAPEPGAEPPVGADPIGPP
jgi:hypothetical protein